MIFNFKYFLTASENNTGLKERALNFDTLLLRIELDNEAIDSTIEALQQLRQNPVNAYAIETPQFNVQFVSLEESGE